MEGRRPTLTMELVPRRVCRLGRSQVAARTKSRNRASTQLFDEQRRVYPIREHRAHLHKTENCRQGAGLPRLDHGGDQEALEAERRVQDETWRPCLHLKDNGIARVATTGDA